MAKLIDFNCKYAQYSGMSKDFAAGIGLSLPDAYFHAQTIAALAEAMRQKAGASCCVLPFDPVLEAENLGAKIKFDDSPLGPRKEQDIITKIEDLSELTPMNPDRGRLAETLRAVELLQKQGIPATVELHGPITIINGLGDIMKILMGWRKHPELMDQFFTLIQDGLISTSLALRKAGADIIYYTDSAGGLDILGPKYAKQITENFTVPFLKALDQALERDCVIHLCPKTSFLLAGYDKASWEKLSLPEPMTYFDACLYAKGKVRVLGQRCRKDLNIKVNVVNYLKLS